MITKSCDHNRLMERCPKANFFCLQQLYASYRDWCNFGIKLVPPVPTRQLLAWDWYWFKSYQFGWFFDIKISTNLYIKVLAWYLPNIGLYQCWFFFKSQPRGWSYFLCPTQGINNWKNLLRSFYYWNTFNYQIS